MTKNEFVNFLEPVEGNIQRPLWSVLIPTYNCAHYLRETLVSVLIQDQGPELMEIAVFDDCSEDDPEAVVAELGKGRIAFYRQSQNVGHIRNFETALKHSRGRLIHLLHGDDRVIWGFYREMGKLFNDNSEIAAGYCRHYFIDDKGDQGYISPLVQKHSGIMHDYFERMLQRSLVQTPAMVVKRNVYEQIGMFDHRFICMEDYEMWTRIGKYFPVGYCKTPLAEYRNFRGSHTARTIRSGKVWNTMLLLNRVWMNYNEGLVPRLEKILIQNMATTSWYDIQTLWVFNDKSGAWKLLRDALRLPVSLKQKLRLIKVFFNGWAKSIKRDTHI